MLFFFELFLFVLIMLTLALGEFVSRGLALVLWLVVTAFAIGGYFLAWGALRPLIEGGGLPSREELDASGEAAREPPPVLDQKWARTLLYNWRRTNALLLLGAVAAGGWYWLGS
jgi:hypothetical protein